MSKVFISHKNTDVEIARKVSDRVKRNGLGTYLDVIDDALLKDGPELADHLLRRMSACDQLIAVVSSQTKESWWVPWEIGVGSEKGFRMASYSERYVTLPSYLEKWPNLKSDSDIDLYCQYSKATQSRIDEGVRGFQSEGARVRIFKSNAFDFHRDLKAALNR